MANRTLKNDARTGPAADPYATPRSDLQGSSRTAGLATNPVAVQDWERATARRRLLNYLIDTVAVMGLGFPAGLIIVVASKLLGSDLDPESTLNQVPDFLWGLGLTLLYYGVCEGVWGRTMGKLLTGTAVLRQDGRPLGIPLALLRTVCRFIPFEAFTFLQGERPNGLHDRWAKSAVVEVRRRRQTIADISNMVA